MGMRKGKVFVGSLAMNQRSIDGKKTSPATSITGHEFDPAEPVMFILPVRVQSHVPGSYEGFDLRFRIPRENFAIRRLSRCLDPALISAAPHYGLRYGCAPAAGDFQRLRGRPPLVSPLKSCMGRSFTAVTRVQIPSGTPNLINNLDEIWRASSC